MNRSRIALVVAIVAVAFITSACTGGPSTAKASSTVAVNGSPCAPTTVSVPTTASADGWNANATATTNVNITLTPCGGKKHAPHAKKTHTAKPAPVVKKPVATKPVTPPAATPCNCPPAANAPVTPKPQARREEFTLPMPSDLDTPDAIIRHEAQEVRMAKVAMPATSQPPTASEPAKACKGRRCR